MELERETPGLGLGLYIVRTLVRRLHGTIRVRDREGGPGTTFEVTLPVVSCRRGHARRGSGDRVRPRGGSRMTLHDQHIVIVEDEEHLAIGLKFNLEAEGYRVTNFKDGLSALTMIQEHPADVDLLILDLMLPGMSGYNVCETLRGLGWDKPVLILSARTLPDDRKRGFDVGANQYMSKPFDLDELISRVRNLLTHYRPRVDDPRPIDQLRIRQGAHQLRRPSRPPATVRRSA